MSAGALRLSATAPRQAIRNSGARIASTASAFFRFNDARPRNSRARMLQFALKVLITAIVVVAVAELAKRSSVWAAALASLPLTSLLAFIWLYVDTGDPGRIAMLSGQIF